MCDMLYTDCRRLDKDMLGDIASWDIQWHLANMHSEHLQCSASCDEWAMELHS